MNCNFTEYVKYIELVFKNKEVIHQMHEIGYVLFLLITILNALL